MAEEISASDFVKEIINRKSDFTLRIWLSYTAGDSFSRKSAMDLQMLLEKEGYDVVTLNDVENFGDSLVTSVAKIVGDVDAIIVLVTSATRKSQNAISELIYAMAESTMDEGPAFLPIVLGDNVHIPSILRSYGTINISDLSRNETGLAPLYSKLKEIEEEGFKLSPLPTPDQLRAYELLKVQKVILDSEESSFDEVVVNLNKKFIFYISVATILASVVSVFGILEAILHLARNNLNIVPNSSIINFIYVSVGLILGFFLQGIFVKMTRGRDG